MSSNGNRNDPSLQGVDISHFVDTTKILKAPVKGVESGFYVVRYNGNLQRVDVLVETPDLDTYLLRISGGKSTENKDHDWKNPGDGIVSYILGILASGVNGRPSFFLPEEEHHGAKQRMMQPVNYYPVTPNGFLTIKASFRSEMVPNMTYHGPDHPNVGADKRGSELSRILTGLGF